VGGAEDLVQQALDIGSPLQVYQRLLDPLEKLVDLCQKGAWSSDFRSNCR
jgi:hypothetical protein